MKVTEKTCTRYENEYNGISVIGTIGYNPENRFLICRNKSSTDAATMYLELADLKILGHLINEVVAEIEKDHNEQT